MATTSKQATRTQTERRAATQAAVLRSARKLFGKRGYDNTSLEDIAKDCGTTIRPIYHYYKNKKQLFKAVVDATELELVAALESVETDEDNPPPLADYWQSFIKLAKKKSFQQIMLIDSPHILGKERWMETTVVAKAGEIISKLRPDLDQTSHYLFTRMLVGALAEAALVFAETDSKSEDKILETIFKAIQPGFN